MSVTFQGATLGLALLAVTATGPTAPAKRGLPFVHDDYARAVREARARKVPIFIEAWAPW